MPRSATLPLSSCVLSLLCAAVLGGSSGAVAAANLLPLTLRTELNLSTGAVREVYCCMGVPSAFPLSSVHPWGLQALLADTRQADDWQLCSEQTLRGHSALAGGRATGLQYADSLLHRLLPAALNPATSPWQGPAQGFDHAARRVLVQRTLGILRETRDTDSALAFLCATNRRLAGLQRQATAEDLA